jgi:hypothetical protein
VARYPQAKYNTSKNRKQSMTKFCNIYDEKLFLYNKSKGTTTVAWLHRHNKYKQVLGWQSGGDYLSGIVPWVGLVPSNPIYQYTEKMFGCIKVALT